MSQKNEIMIETISSFQSIVAKAEAILEDLKSGRSKDCLVVVNFSGIPFKATIENDRLMDAHISNLDRCTRFPLGDRRAAALAKNVWDGAGRPSRVERLSVAARKRVEEVQGIVDDLKSRLDEV